MPQAKVYNLEGAEIDTIELDDAVFAEKADQALIYQVVRVARANARQPLAHTKTRAEVSGGGRKPWRQKGTGRARHGSIRSPLWRGGGVTFGPRAESVTKLAIPAKMRKKAIRAALSDRVHEGKLVVIGDMGKIEKPSTKKVASFLKKLKLASKKVLFLSDEGQERAILSLRNIPRTKSIRLENINILDVLSYGTLVIARESVEKLTRQLA